MLRFSVSWRRLWGFGHSCNHLQSALGVFALIAFAWAVSENRRAVSLAADRRRARPHIRAGRAVPQGAADHARLRLGQSRHRRHRRGKPRRHLVRVRLYRRRRAAVRAEVSGQGIRAGVQRAADRAADERADHAAVLLGHPAAGRERLCLCAQPHDGRRRRGRAFHRRQHLRRPCRGAAVHPALSRASFRGANCSW